MTSKYYLIINKESVEEQLVKSEVKNIVPEIKVFRDKKYEVYNIQPPTSLPDLERFGRIEENFFDETFINKIRSALSSPENKSLQYIKNIYQDYIEYLSKEVDHPSLKKILVNINKKNFYDVFYEEMKDIIKNREIFKSDYDIFQLFSYFTNKVLNKKFETSKDSLFSILRDIFYCKIVIDINNNTIEITMNIMNLVEIFDSKIEIDNKANLSNMKKYFNNNKSDRFRQDVERPLCFNETQVANAVIQQNQKLMSLFPQAGIIKRFFPRYVIFELIIIMNKDLYINLNEDILGLYYAKLMSTHCHYKFENNTISYEGYYPFIYKNIPLEFNYTKFEERYFYFTCNIPLDLKYIKFSYKNDVELPINVKYRYIKYVAEPIVAPDTKPEVKFLAEPISEKEEPKEEEPKEEEPKEKEPKEKEPKKEGIKNDTKLNVNLNITKIVNKISENNNDPTFINNLKKLLFYIADCYMNDNPNNKNSQRISNKSIEIYGKYLKIQKDKKKFTETIMDSNNIQLKKLSSNIYQSEK